MRFTLGHRRLALIVIVMFILPIMGCDLNAETDIQPPNSPSELPQPERTSLRLYFPPLPDSHPLADLSYALEVRDEETGRVVLRDWVTATRLSAEELEAQVPSELLSPLPLPSQDTLSYETPLLPLGRYELTLFIERQASITDGGAPRFSECPSPPSLRSPFELEGVDPLFARWRGELSDTSPRHLWLELKRVSCGPGDLNTQLLGLCVIQAERLPITYVSISDPDEEQSSLPSLIFPLQEFLISSTPTEALSELESLELSGADTAYQFMIPQLRAGRVNVSLFTDDDQDLSPSPCQRLNLTGADRAISEQRDLLIERGSPLTIEEPFLLNEVVACEGVVVNRSALLEDDLIALSGQVELSDSLLQALQSQRTHKGLWYQLGAGEPHPLADLYQLMRGQGRFTLLAPPSELTAPSPLKLWVDQGSDGRFEPCSPEGEQGVDVRWWSGTSEQLTPLGEGAPTSSISLDSSCEAPEALVSGQIEVSLDVDEGWAPRPLVIEREDLFTGVVSPLTLGVLSREELSNTLLNFEHRVSAGSYAYRAYLDQGTDRGFSPCELGQLGEVFATSSEVLVSVAAGSLSTDVTLRLAPLSCVTPRATLLITPQAPNTTQVVSGVCRSQELLVSVSSGGEELISPRCLPLNERGELAIEGLYGGSHTVTLCQEVAPVPVTGLPCAEARAISAEAEVVMRWAPTQREALGLEHHCECPSPAN